ncbi:hypothetical protein AB3N61_09300 [Leptospira sp. WS58.C1]|uniref:hypothetical protein n=1 Tax=Leptospira cinconiae TaxID=3235173 RepID=UPI00349EE9AC
MKYRFFIYFSGSRISSFWPQGVPQDKSNYPFLFFPERLLNADKERMSFILPGPESSADSQYMIGAFINAFNRTFAGKNKIVKTSVQQIAETTTPAKVDTTLPPNPAMYVPPTQTTELTPDEEFITTGMNLTPFVVIAGLFGLVAVAASKMKKKRK